MKWRFEASFENWEWISGELDQELCRNNIAVSIKRKLLMAAEELVSNVIFYSGAEGKMTKIELILQMEEMIVLEIIDDGVAFNPLENPEPKISGDSRRARPGGLGIYMARNLVDGIGYEYKEGKNHLILQKKKERVA